MGPSRGGGGGYKLSWIGESPWNGSQRLQVLTPPFVRAVGQSSVKKGGGLGQQTKNRVRTRGDIAHKSSVRRRGFRASFRRREPGRRGDRREPRRRE